MKNKKNKKNLSSKKPFKTYLKRLFWFLV